MVEYAVEVQEAQTETELAEPPDPLDVATRLLTHAFDQSPAFPIGSRVWAAFVAQAVVDGASAEIVVPAQIGLEDEVARLLTAADHGPQSARFLVALSEGLARRTLTGALTANAAVAEMHGAISAVCR